MAIRDLTARIRVEVDTSGTRPALKSTEREVTNLETAFKELERQGEKSFDGVSGSVLSLERRLEKADAAADKLRRDLQKKVRLNVDTDKLESELESADRAAEALRKRLKRINDTRVDKAESSISKLRTVALGAAAAIATGFIAGRRAIEQFEQATRKAGQERSLETQLRRSGIELEGFVRQLDEAARGALSRADAIAASTRAIALGVDTEAIPRLLEVARNSAIATGQTVTKAFQDIALGTARQSRLILDNLGIIVSVEEANERYAVSLGKTAEELTNVEKRAAFLNEVLRKGEASFSDIAEAASSSASALQQLTANITDLKDELARGVAESDTLTIAFNILSASLGDTAALKNAQKEWAAYTTILTALRVVAPGLADIFSKNTREALKLAEATGELSRQTENLTEKQAAASKEAEEYGKNIDSLIAAGFSLAEATELLTDRSRDHTAALRLEEEAAKSLESSYELLGVVTDAQIEKEIAAQEGIIAHAEAMLRAGEIQEGTYARSVRVANIEIDRLIETLDSGYIPAVDRQAKATEAAAAAGDKLNTENQKQAITSDAAAAEVDLLTASLTRLTAAQLAAAAAGEIVNGTVGLGGTRVSFGTERDAEGNIVQSPGSRLIRSDRNGGYTLRSGGTFRTVGSGIPANFSSFSFEGLGNS